MSQYALLGQLRIDRIACLFVVCCRLREKIRWFHRGWFWVTRHDMVLYDAKPTWQCQTYMAMSRVPCHASSPSSSPVEIPVQEFFVSSWARQYAVQCNSCSIFSCNSTTQSTVRYGPHHSKQPHCPPSHRHYRRRPSHHHCHYRRHHPRAE
jgi:hypothetical protein